jgi:hypothetical protein
MGRCVDFVRADEQRNELSSASMQATQLRGRDRVVQGIAQQLVSEVVVAVVDLLERVQERARDELVQRRIEVADRAIHHAGQHVRREASAHDGARQRDGLCIV